jgi:hypothetical protein
LHPTSDELTDSMTQEYFEQGKSRTNRALDEALGPQLAAAYQVHADGGRPGTRFGLRIAPGAMRSESIAPASHRDAASLAAVAGPTPVSDPRCPSQRRQRAFQSKDPAAET